MYLSVGLKGMNLVREYSCHRVSLQGANGQRRGHRGWTGPQNKPKAMQAALARGASQWTLDGHTAEGRAPAGGQGSPVGVGLVQHHVDGLLGDDVGRLGAVLEDLRAVQGTSGRVRGQASTGRKWVKGAACPKVHLC